MYHGANNNSVAYNLWKMPSDETFFHYAVVTLFLITPPTYLSCRYTTAPYGRHHRKGWGPTIPSSLAWFLMESPTVWFTLVLFPLGQHKSNPKSIILISPFLFHYIHRTFIYPLRIYRSKKQYPVSIALMAFIYNLFNSYLQTRWVSQYADDYESDVWFWIRFCCGLLVFTVGMFVNVRSDMMLVRLKKKDDNVKNGYKIPRNGLFEYVSCANYFGEIVEWFGWAVMTGSWVGLGFMLYTCANLVPRAVANHKWYLEKFGEDYPKQRKAVFPFLY
uniref:steroid 5-alpha-reductase DET2 n=1 Tax=Erigeron canadensis TaxID=72917 RepID=UPI001CB88FF2|nr:steroid 5-alpha-reductase DET2 [Erigeron canadensis]